MDEKTELAMRARKYLQELAHLVMELDSRVNLVVEASRVMSGKLQMEKQIIACGAGMTRPLAEHFTAELIGRFRQDRPALPAFELVAEHDNDSTAWHVARMVRAFAREEDVLVVIGLFRDSDFIQAALNAGREKGATTVALSAADGDGLRDFADYSIVVPSSDPHKVIEAELTFLHMFCELIEPSMAAWFERRAQSASG